MKCRQPSAERDRSLKNLYSGIRSFQDNLADGLPNEWRCRAGARYLYICEDGLVHYCSQQRGYPGTPLSSYTTADIVREFSTAEVVRAVLHGRLRPPGLDDGLLAIAAGRDCEQTVADRRPVLDCREFLFPFLLLRLFRFLLRFLPAARRLQPVGLVGVLHLVHDVLVRDDDANLAALVEFQTAQALAADERAAGRRG